MWRGLCVAATHIQDSSQTELKTVNQQILYCKFYNEFPTFDCTVFNRKILFLHLKQNISCDYSPYIQ